MRLIGQLSIDNLLNTDWEDQFDVHQLRQIYDGYKRQVDVMVYANPHYHHRVMKNLKVVMVEKPECINEAITIANNDELTNSEKVQQINQLVYPNKDIQE